MLLKTGRVNFSGTQGADMMNTGISDHSNNFINVISTFVSQKLFIKLPPGSYNLWEVITANSGTAKQFQKVPLTWDFCIYEVRPSNWSQRPGGQRLAFSIKTELKLNKEVLHLQTDMNLLPKRPALLEGLKRTLTCTRQPSGRWVTSAKLNTHLDLSLFYDIFAVMLLLLK